MIKTIPALCLSAVWAVGMFLSPGCARPKPQPAPPAPVQKPQSAEKPSRPPQQKAAATALLTGLSVPPPPGKNWSMASKSSDAVTFVKDTGSTSRSFMALASTVSTGISFDRPEEFLTWTRESRKKDTDPKRFRLLAHREKLDAARGDFCVRYHLKAEDRGAAVKSEPLLLLEVNGFSCLHPEDPYLLMDFRYAERYPPGKQEKNLRREGERFLQRVSFTPLR